MKFLSLPYWFGFSLILILVLGTESVVSLEKNNVPTDVLGITNEASNVSTLEEEIDYWQRLLAYQPTYVDAHLRLSVLYWDSGEKSKSLYHYQQAQDLDPNNHQLNLIERLID